MSEVKWIKLAIDVFNNRKIRQLETLPDGDSILVIWIKMLCLAGSINDDGYVYFAREIPYTDQMLATQFNRPLPTVQLALSMFEKYGMIEIIDDILKISNWEKYQNSAGLKDIREYNRIAQQKHRAKLKSGAVIDLSLTSQKCQGTDREEESDKETEKESDTESEIEEYDMSSERTSSAVPYQKIKELYHSICISYPQIKAIEGKRKQVVAARWHFYKSLDSFEKMFRIAESSSFLKGQNDKDWSADFDWMMKATNFLKILEHKYDEHPANGKASGVFGTLQRMYEEAGSDDEAGNC